VNDIVILRGEHKTREEGMCAMELVAYLAGEEHSDHPRCACPVLAGAARGLNDRIRDDAKRTRIMLPVAEALVGSRRDAATEQRRAYRLTDFAVRVAAPAALDAVGYTEDAARLRALSPIVDPDTARTASDAANARAFSNALAYAAYAAAAAAADVALAYAAAAAACAAGMHVALAELIVALANETP
jgi:hypothetical protein